MSKIIKCGNWANSPNMPFEVKPVHLSEQLNEARVSAESILEKARREAEIIIRTARAEMEAEARAVREQAYLEGYKAGLAEGAAQATDLINELEARLAEIPAIKEEIVSKIEPDVVKLCTEIAEKIIRHEVRTDPKVIIRTVNSCLRRVKGCDDIRIRVSPEEIEALKAHRDELLGVGDGIRTVEIIDDRRVSPGGCVIETSSGDFDARIETQLGKVAQTLKETLENDANQPDTGPDEV